MATPAQTPDTKTLPLSIYQRPYWLKSTQNPASSAFSASVVFEISGPLDREALKQAFHFVTQKHDITHATFNADGSAQYYTAFDIDEFVVERACVTEDINTELRTILNEPFDLAVGPLLRVHLLTTSQGTAYLIVTTHHVIADGPTARIMTADVALAYLAICSDPSSLEPQHYSYSACIDALRALRTPENQRAAQEFWRTFLKDTPPTIAFPQESDAVARGYSVESMFFELDEVTTQSLRAFAHENRTTLFIVLFALYGLLLSRYARQDEVVVSYPVDMRPADHGHVFGCFTNRILLKVAIDRDTTFRTLVAQVTRQRREVRPHQPYSLQAELGLDVNSYFDVFFGETHLRGGGALEVNGVSIKPLDIPWSEESDRILRLLYEADGHETIKLRMDFRSGLFDPAVITRFVEDFKAFSSSLAPDQCLLPGESEASAHHA
jgi:hypothetical protein